MLLIYEYFPLKTKIETHLFEGGKIKLWEKESVSHSVVSNSLQPHGLQPARILCPWKSPGKNSGMGCHSLLHGIFSTQGLNLGLLHHRQILCHLSHQRNPILTQEKLKTTPRSRLGLLILHKDIVLGKQLALKWSPGWAGGDHQAGVGWIINYLWHPTSPHSTR